MKAIGWIFYLILPPIISVPIGLLIEKINKWVKDPGHWIRALDQTK